MCVRTHVWMCLCVRVCAFVSVFVYVCEKERKTMYVRVCVSVYVLVCESVCIYMCVLCVSANPKPDMPPVRFSAALGADVAPDIKMWSG